MKTFFIDWNLIPYAEAWQRQTEWFDNIVRAKVQGESCLLYTSDAEKTNVKKLQAGFNKFSYEAEFVKETKKDNQKADKK